MPSYLDTSVIVSTLVAEPRTPSVIRFLAAHRDDLVVTEFAAGEVASAISRMVRRLNISSTDGHGVLERFDSWRARSTVDADVENSDFQHARLLVRRFELKLRMPDALHLAAAQRLGATLVTADGTLAGAARDLAAPVIAF